MIDHLDKQTQSLPLEPKRGRGRPATGQALSNAERQRLYRERHKAQRDEKTTDEKELFELINEAKKQENYWMERALQAEKKLAQRNDNELMKRVELAEAERDAMGNELAKAKAKLSKAGPTKRRYLLEWQDPETGKWEDDTSGQQWGRKSEAEASAKRMNAPGFSDVTWRVRERQWV